MKELVEVIARALVDNPDEVVVTETEKEGGTFIELKVAPSDMGKVIGKQGRIAKAIRSVVKQLLPKKKKRLLLYSIAGKGCRRSFQRQLFSVHRKLLLIQPLFGNRYRLLKKSEVKEVKAWMICFGSVSFLPLTECGER